MTISRPDFEAFFGARAIKDSITCLMPGLPSRPLHLLPLSQRPAHELRCRLSRLSVRFGIIMGRLCIWSQTAYPGSFIIKSRVQECWMQDRVLGLFCSAAKSIADNFWEQRTFSTRIAGRLLLKLKDRASM